MKTWLKKGMQMNKKNTDTLNNLFTGIDQLKQLSGELKSDHCVALTMAIYEMEDDLNFLIDQISYETNNFDPVKIYEMFGYPEDHKHNKKFMDIYNRYKDQE